ncbi:F0F1 ATP synthase subunit A [Gammaproteobacteria bacterium]|nr:F0F1 ATP synthase subunit A [Gammaproteobacteria bacterium]
MAVQELTAKEYIMHHLTNLTNTGKAQGLDAQNFIDFSVFNVDTLIWSLIAGALGFYVFYKAAQKATPGVPGRFQMAIEMLIEMVENQSKSLVNSESRYIAPLALTIFFWVVIMNSFDLIPVDLPSVILAMFTDDIHYLRVVPTADPSSTLGMALGILILTIYYGIKVKGFGGFLHELFGAPFGAKWYLIPCNFMLNIVEYVAKTLSLGIRLFGNMFAGELVFCLIALLGGMAGIYGMGMHLIAGTAWAIFHILVILLQAYIFMMLSLVYIGQAHEHH